MKSLLEKPLDLPLTTQHTCIAVEGGVLNSGRASIIKKKKTNIEKTTKKAQRKRTSRISLLSDGKNGLILTRGW